MFGFDKKRRLLNKCDYDVVFKQAKKLTVAEFIFLYRPNELGFPRLGLAISKKAVAKAHDRNRIKRLLRETFRVSSHLPNLDVIVLIRGKVSHLQNSAINVNLDKAWNKLALSCAK